MFPIEKKAVLNAVALGILGNNVTQDINIEAFLKPEYLDGAFNSFMSRIWAKFVVFGNTSAGMFAIFLIAKVIKFGLDTVFTE